jgi:hypothetical protein
VRLENLKTPIPSHLQYLQNYPSRVLRVLRVTAVGAFYFSRSGERMKRVPKRIRHKPWCAIHLPSIGRRDCWYEDDDGDRRPVQLARSLLDCAWAGAGVCVLSRAIGRTTTGPSGSMAGLLSPLLGIASATETRAYPSKAHLLMS